MLKRISFGILITVALICPVLAQDGDEALYYGGFDGRWEGRLKAIPAEAYDADHGTGGSETFARVAFQIDGRDVHVYLGENEILPGLFQLVRHKTNAVIVALNSSADVRDVTGSGGWVETLNFSLSHKDKDGLYVFWTRMVNNYLQPFDYKAGNSRGRFFITAFGEVTRVSGK